MSWRYVYDTNGHYNTLPGAAEAVHKTPYKFFCFNGEVYFIIPNGEYYATRQTVDDLF